MDTKTKFTEMIPEQRVSLNNINWQLLEKLLNARKDNNISRISYCQGRLEFMSPFWGHEIINKRIEKMIWVLTDELNMEMGKAGQGRKVILKKENMDIAKEPDACYYAHQNAPQAKDKINVDLSEDIPPDLAIEIDQPR
ncbi:MAG TPA: Uma2 family endonuclease, partial [Allocoleopsis sp.]